MERNIRPSIKRLPDDVQALIRSGNIITNTSQCVTELVLNAIDAGATKIAVRVNFNYYKILVADNGCGMSSAELNLIGERFMTSKCHSLKDLESNLPHYGFRGEALASLKECSGVLTLESRSEGSNITYAKVYTCGKLHSLGISKTSRPACGTTVTVQDFMYNMPVRRGRMQPNIEIEEIKSSLESIALIHPEVSFSLHNEVNHQLILQTLKTSGVIGAFSQLFSKALGQTLVPVNYSMKQYSIDGYIGNETHGRKNLQFIYVNKRLVLKTKLHKLANTVLGMSFLLRQNAPPCELPANRDYTTEQWLFFSTPYRDQYAVYIFNIICPHKEYDICLEPKKTLIEFKDWDSVLQCLKGAIETFLQTECNPFSSQGERNAQYQSQEKSVLAEMSQLDKEYALGKYDKISQKSKKTESVVQTEYIEDNYIVKKKEKFLPGIHNIFGAVCGEQAKRKTSYNKIVSDETTSSKSTRKFKVDEEHQEMFSQSTLVLQQETSSKGGKHTSYKLKIDEEDLSSSPSTKAFVPDHSKKKTLSCKKRTVSCKKRTVSCKKRTSSAADPLKPKGTPVVETSNIANINLDVATNEQSKHHITKSLDIQDNVSSTCPVVKFRRMYGNSESSINKDEIMLNVEHKRRPFLQRCIEENTSSHAQRISNARNHVSMGCITEDNESKHSSKHISTKTIFIRSIDSSISGISEVPIIESKIKCSSEETVAGNKTSIRPIHKFRLSVAKKLSHKVQNANCPRSLEKVKHLTPKAVASVNECRMHKPIYKSSSQQNISATKASISISTINVNIASRNNGSERNKECVSESFKSLLEEVTYRTQSSVSEEKSVIAKLQQQNNVREEAAKKLSECSKDMVFQRPVQLQKVKCNENGTLKHCKSLNNMHSCCLYNSRDKEWLTLEQSMSIDKKNTNCNSILLPLWSLNYINKRKGNLQMFPKKRKVHFHDNPFYINNGFKDSISKTELKETVNKYVTSSDFLHTVNIKDQKYAIKHQSTANLGKSESRKKNPLILCSDNVAKYVPEMWRLKAENNTLHFARNHNFGHNLNFIFSPKQDTHAQLPTLNDLFPKTKCSTKGSNKNIVNENIVETFSSDIMKHCRNIITLSSGNEADVDTTISLKTCGTNFLSHISHLSSERDVNTASEILSQTYKQQMSQHVKDSDHSNDKNINFYSNKLVKHVTVSGEKDEVSHSHALTDVSPPHHSRICASAEQAPTVHNFEENNIICTLTTNDKVSDFQSQYNFKDTGAALIKSGDNAAVPCVNDSPTDCQFFYGRWFSNNSINSADVDISSLISQRVTEDNLKDEDRNFSVKQITSNCLSPAISNSNETSDISLNYARSKQCYKNLIIEETSSEIIDVTPEVNTVSKELCLFEKSATKSSINRVERQESISFPDKQNEKESNSAESDKCETVNICDKVMNEMHKEANKESDQERKRSSDIDLSYLYGKRVSLEKDVPDHSIGSILSGCTDILNEAFDMVTKVKHSGNQKQTHVTTAIVNEREVNETELKNSRDDFMQKHKVKNNEFETIKSKKQFQNETDGISFNNLQNNCYNTRNVSDIQEATKELQLSTARETSSRISLKLVSENSDERENKVPHDVCNTANNDVLEEWKKKIDFAGRQFYVHGESGMPLFCIPDSKSAGASYSMSERYGFLPKGLSPILKENVNNLSKQQDILTPNTRHAFHDALVQNHSEDLIELKMVKWRDIQEFKESGCKDLLETLVKDSEYSMQFCEKEVPTANAKGIPNLCNTADSRTFSKEIFSTLKILRQLDKKFIVVITMCKESKLPNYVVLFDQHAIHERIRVEQLVQDYQEENSDAKFKTSKIDSVILSLGKDDIHILQSFRNYFENLGIHFELVDDSTTVQVSSVPTCFLMREEREDKNNGISVLKTLLESLIREQIDSLVATRGCAAPIPNILQAVITSEACKGALKFGDELATKDCRMLLSSLSSCKLPFHCAHGRPSLTTLVDLKKLYIHQKPVYKPPALHKLSKLFTDQK